MKRLSIRFRKTVNRIKNCGGIGGICAKSYQKMIERRVLPGFGTASFPTEDERKRQREEVFENPVKISILVPLWNNEESYQRQLLESCMNQTYENWELCFADGSDEDHSYLQKICKLAEEKAPGKIKYKKLDENLGIAGNTNACLEMATGEYIGLLDQDDLLHPSALYEYVKVIVRTKADFLYCDEITFCGHDINQMDISHFKPDYAPDNLLANNYICHFSVFRKSLLEGEELFRQAFDGSQDHDMILRLTNKAKRIEHIPKVLYYWRNHKTSVASGLEAKPYVVSAGKRAVADALVKQGYTDFSIESTRAFPTIFKINYSIIGEPKVAILLQECDTKEEIEKMAAAIFRMTDYPKVAICTYEEYKNGKEADAEYLLFVKKGIRILNKDWLRELLMYAQRENTGAVGAKVYDGNGKIYHAGIVIGVGKEGVWDYAYRGYRKQNLGYMGDLCYARNVTAVTSDALMIAAKKYREIGKMEDTLTGDLKDLDFCLKLRTAGYLNVITPFAEVQKRDRARSTMKAQKETFLLKWRDVLQQNDPYYNINFSIRKADFSMKR